MANIRYTNNTLLDITTEAVKRNYFHLQSIKSFTSEMRKPFNCVWTPQQSNETLKQTHSNCEEHLRCSIGIDILQIFHSHWFLRETFWCLISDVSGVTLTFIASRSCSASYSTGVAIRATMTCSKCPLNSLFKSFIKSYLTNCKQNTQCKKFIINNMMKQILN